MYSQCITTFSYAQLFTSRMCTSFTLWCLCLPPNITTRERSTFVKENAAQGGGRGPVVSGELQVATEWERDHPIIILLLSLFYSPTFLLCSYHSICLVYTHATNRTTSMLPHTHHYIELPQNPLCPKFASHTI